MTLEFEYKCTLLYSILDVAKVDPFYKTISAMLNTFNPSNKKLKELRPDMDNCGVTVLFMSNNLCETLLASKKSKEKDIFELSKELAHFLIVFLLEEIPKEQIEMTLYGVSRENILNLGPISNVSNDQTSYMSSIKFANKTAVSKCLARTTEYTFPSVKLILLGRCDNFNEKLFGEKQSKPSTLCNKQTYLVSKNKREILWEKQTKNSFCHQLDNRDFHTLQIWDMRQENEIYNLCCKGSQNINLVFFDGVDLLAQNSTERIKLTQILTKISFFDSSKAVILFSISGNQRENTLLAVEKCVQEVITDAKHLHIIQQEPLSFFLDIVELKKCLSECVRKSKKIFQNDIWSRPIPYSWILLMENLTGSLTSTYQILKKSRSLSFSKDDLDRFLEFFGSCGILVDFRTILNCSRNPYNVVMDTNLLLGCLSSIIFKSWYDTRRYRRSVSSKLRTLYWTYTEKGALAESLVNSLLSDFNLPQVERLFILSLCEKMLLIIRIPHAPEMLNLEDDVSRLEHFWISTTMIQPKPANYADKKIIRIKLDFLGSTLFSQLCFNAVLVILCREEFVRIIEITKEGITLYKHEEKSKCI